MTGKKKKFSIEMHYFRAFAIITVVLTHTFLTPGQLENPQGAGKVMDIIRQAFFLNATIYFVFISGFLFHYLSYKFEVKKYFKSKLTNVIIPYLIWTTLATVSNTFVSGVPFSVSDLPEIIFLGKAQVQYWYIPFITIVFLISPFLLKFSPTRFTQICIPVAFLPLLGTRTGTEITFYQYVYFLPVYMVGMLCSLHFEFMMEKIVQYWGILLAVAAASTVGIVYIVANDIKYSVGPMDLLWSVTYITRISSTFLVILLFSKMKRKSAFLDNVATLSFALYFMHWLFYKEAIRDFAIRLVDGFIPYWIVCIAYTIFNLLLTIGIAYVAKKVFGKYSRMLTGA
jgi:probable poly-beta-1,6-N-acetyl-D-glucosamine export protein